MADLTPAQIAEMRREQEALNKAKAEGLEYDKARLASLNAYFETQKRSIDKSQEELDSLRKRLDLLTKSAEVEESNYVRKLREKEAGDIRLKMIEEEHRLLTQIALTDNTMSEERQKQLETLNKMLPTVRAMRTAEKANSDLLNSKSATQAKIEQSVYRVLDAAQKGDLGKLMYKSLENSLNSLANKGFNMLTSAIKEFVFAYDEAITGFEKQFQLGPQLTKQIESQYAEYAELGATIGEVGEAYGALSRHVTDFTMMTEAEQTALSDVAIVLQEQGIAFDDMAVGMQAANKFFGQSAGEMSQTSLELAETARALGRSPAELSAEFAAAAPSLAKFGEEGVKAFKDLSRISKITGMDLDKILSMTNRFDTFEGAAEQAGKLNAALGGNMVNAMDLMTATDPAERFMMIRDAIDETGLSFDDMSYYQKQYFAEAAGLDSVGDLALMLRGDMEGLAGAANKTADELADEAERAREMQTAQEDFARAMSEVMVELMPAMQTFRDIAKFIGDNAEAIATLIKAFIIYKGVMVGVNIAMALYKGFLIAQRALELAGAASKGTAAAATTTKAAAISAEATANGLLATSITGIATAQAAAVPAAKAYAKMMGFISKQLAAATPGLTAFGTAALKASIPLAIFMLGMIGFAVAIKDVPWQQLVAGTGMIVALGFGIAKGSAAMAAGLTVLSNPKVALGAAIFVGVLWSIAGAVYLMTDAFAQMFESLGIGEGGGSVMEFALALGIMAVAGTALLVASTGLIIFAGAMGLLGLALFFVNQEKLNSIATFADAMSRVSVGSLAELAGALERVAEAMEEIPETKAIMLTATLDAAGIAARAAGALGNVNVGGGGGDGQNMFSARSAVASARNQPPINVNVTLELDGEVLSRKIIEVNRDSQASGGAMSAVDRLLL